MLTLSHTFSCWEGAGRQCQGIISKWVRWKISKSVLFLFGGGHDSPDIIVESTRAHIWNKINCLWTKHSVSSNLCVLCHLKEIRLGEQQPFFGSKQSWESGKPLTPLVYIMIFYISVEKSQYLYAWPLFNVSSFSDAN